MRAIALGAYRAQMISSKNLLWIRSVIPEEIRDLRAQFFDLL